MNLLPSVVNVLLLAAIIVNFCLLVFMFLKGERKLSHNFLIIHFCGILVWAAGIFLSLHFLNDLFIKIIFASALILAFSKYLFVIVFPENKFPKGIKYYLFFIPAAFIFAVLFFNGTLFKNIKIVDGYYIYRENGPFSLFYSLIIFYFLIAPIVIAFKKYKYGNYNKTAKLQIKYLFFGMTIAALFGLLTNSILPVFFDIYFFNGIGPVLTLILAAFILYVIRQHNFLNISLYVQRGVIYALLLGVIVGFYFAIISFFGFIFQQTANFTILMSAGITAIIGIFSVPPIEKYFRRLTDKIFFKDKYDYSQALHELSGVLNNNFEIEKILNIVSEKLKQIFKASGLNLSLNIKNQSEIDKLNKKYNAKLIIPIIFENDLMGALFMGEKLSGDYYTKEDVALLKTFSHQAAVALKKAEFYEKIKNYSRELENEVKKRTVKIEKMQEEQKRMMIDISHAMQTPLVVIKNELEFLQKRMPDNKKIKAFEKSIDGVSKTIYNLLSLAKLETQEEFSKETFDLSSLLEEIIEYFRVAVENKNIIVESRIGKNITILGNKEKIEDLIINLLSNASKYILSGGKISVSLFKDNGKIKIAVEDTGIGIDKSDLPHIFERFYRVKNNAQKGTGLGLAICKRIVEKHNGDIFVDSQIGKGTKFTVIFPDNSA